MDVLAQAALYSQTSSEAAPSWVPKEVKRLRKAVEQLSGGRLPMQDGDFELRRDLEPLADQIDWHVVSQVHVRSRSHEECRAKWIDLVRYPIQKV